MWLPLELRSRIERQLQAADRSLVTRAAEQIITNYKSGLFSKSLRSHESRVAYLATRLPATYAANHYVFAEIRRVFPEFGPVDMLDLGAGPGTALWAAREVWPSLRSFALIDSNKDLLQLGQQLADGIPATHWMEANLSDVNELQPSDLVVLSYSLGEIPKPDLFITRAWTAARKVLVVIEPGTPRNFSSVVKIRAQLIEAGAHPIAPCPHVNACPLAVANDWCHFAVRLPRTAEHRILKSGSLGYEDEKFSYLAFTRSQVPTPAARIVCHPAIHGGHIQLSLCTDQGLQSKTVTRSAKAAFRAARSADWGDAWPPRNNEE